MQTEREINKLTELVLLLDEFEKLKNLPKEKQDEKSLKFEEMIRELDELKKRALEKRKNELKELLSENKHRLRLSCFEVMEHNWKENTHSNVLKYLFDYKMIKEGAKILSGFIKNVDGIENSEQIAEIILKENYEITRERPNRIDLFILDTQNGLALVIENKVLSDVAEKEDEEDKKNKTQLDNYKKYVETHHKNLLHGFVLLSYKEIEKEYPPFVMTNYSRLYEVLKSFSGDNILDEYKMLLHSLIYEYDKNYLIRQLRNLKAINSLTTLQQLKQLFHETN